MESSHRRGAMRGYVYVLPALAVYVVFAVLPALHTAYLSLFDWDGVTLGSWVGLDNYREVFRNPVLLRSLVNALALVVFFSFVPILTGLLTTALLSRYRRPGMSVYRLLFMLPQIVPLVAVGVTWRWLYGDDGLVNEALRAVGLDGITRVARRFRHRAGRGRARRHLGAERAVHDALPQRGPQGRPEPLRGGAARRRGPGTGVRVRHTAAAAR